MTDKKWPECQTTHPECVIVWRVNENTSDEFSVENHYSVEESDSVGTGMGAADAHYTRTDIAEARIAELQARIVQLEESAIGGYEDGWHALRNERDALRARIEDAPKVIIRHVAGEPMSMRGYHSGTEDLHGKRVALVPLGDDE